MSRPELDATAKVEGYELNSGRGRRQRVGRRVLLGSMVGSVLVGIVAIALALPVGAFASYTPYYYETECFNKLEKCWSTNFTPESGNLGSQSRIDDVNILPTLNSNGLSYGNPEPNANASTGGDYPWGGGDSTSEQQCKEHPYPPGVSCNYSPSQFVTQNYTDTNGAWHFAMGGGSQCESDGHEVPCNFGHQMRPYDCVGSYSPKCTSTSPQDMPFATGFPSEMYFAVSATLFVGGASGPWHAFLCALLQDATNGAFLQICDEPWNSGGSYQPIGGVTPCTANSTFGQYWQRAGENTSDMTTNGQATSQVGVTINVNWTMNREQFVNLLRRIHSACPQVPLDESMNNWKLYLSEDGIEEIGAAGSGAGINWEESNETMQTAYQGTAHKLAPPEATTSAASEIQPTAAKLNGQVNPNSVDTHYYFEYGPTVRYGTRIPAGEGMDIGSATSPIYTWNNISGLSPATLYHYRLVATSAGGTTEGKDQEFKTPGPVEAVTSAASGVLETQATLNGTVNPRGYDARYYFQYGTTTSYGSSTTEGDAGAGVGAVPENAAVAGLEADIAYHYRLVAMSGGVTSYGSDQTLMLSRQASSRSAVRNPINGEQWVYYRGSNGQIDRWVFNGSWTFTERPGHAAAAGTSPTVIRDPSTGEQWVYYQGSNGQIDLWVFNGSWTFTELGGHPAAAGTSPTVIRNPSTAEQWVYYQGSNGQIDVWVFNGSWTFSERPGHAAAAGTSPTVIRDPNTGEQWVYYQGSNGQIDLWVFNGSWTFTERPAHGAAAHTSPTVIRNPNTAEQWVYYQGSNGQIDVWVFNGSWTFSERPGHAAAAGTSPTVIRDPNTGEQWVYYQGSNGQIDLWVFNGSWTFSERPGHAAAAGTSPTVVRAPSTGEQWVYYQGSNGSMDGWFWNGSWAFGEL